MTPTGQAAAPRIFKTMEERREQELHNLVCLLQDAEEHGAHVFTQPELHPEIDYNDPTAVLPEPTLLEVLYVYGGRHYQAVMSGNGIYHHLLIGTVFSERPFVRKAPGQAPWEHHQAVPDPPAQA